MNNRILKTQKISISVKAITKKKIERVLSSLKITDIISALNLWSKKISIYMNNSYFTGFEMLGFHKITCTSYLNDY